MIAYMGEPGAKKHQSLKGVDKLGKTAAQKGEGDNIGHQEVSYKVTTH